eukprot:scaffold670904_cov122-Attheya_sp.AAC.1
MDAVVVVVVVVVVGIVLGEPAFAALAGHDGANSLPCQSWAHGSSVLISIPVIVRLVVMRTF